MSDKPLAGQTAFITGSGRGLGRAFAEKLASMGANPLHYLAVPRFLSCILLIPTLTIMGIFMGVVGAFGPSSPGRG